MKKIILILTFPILLNGQSTNEIFTMFYNVENFFDTINNPMTSDNEFLPDAKKKWNTEKYNHKINQLSKVFSNINNGNHPNLIGLCEVENKNVINDLLKNNFFLNHTYNIIHVNSPDNRGIDCALLFDKNFKLLKSDFIKINIPDSRPTRDIVYAKLQVNDLILNVFINHWPSRWGGQDKTEHKRIYTASILKNYIKNNIDESEYILIMGDLNDEPHNKSIKDILLQDNLINLMSLLDNEMGSYNYKGKWSFIDHIIISKNIFQPNSKLKIKNYNSYNPEWILYTNENGDKKPNRTFGGNNWYRGFSDHLAIFSTFILEQ